MGLRKAEIELEKRKLEHLERMKDISIPATCRSRPKSITRGLKNKMKSPLFRLSKLGQEWRSL